MTQRQIVNTQTLKRIEKLFQAALDKRDRLDGDEIPSLTEWVTTNLKIKPKHGGVEDFIPKPEQLHLFSILEDCLKKHKPIRLVILKSRQLGMSTAAEAFLFYLTYFWPSTTALVIAHRRDSARQLFLMVKRFYTNLAAWRRKPLSGGRPHRDDLEYEAPHSSQYHVMTAGSEEVGRGWTLQFVHASEMAFWLDPEVSLTALSQAIPKPSETSFSAFIIESTANGQNLFKQYWDLAQDPHSDWTPLFYSWVNDPSCTIPIGPKETFVLDKEEQAFQQEHSLSLPQMRWCRQIREDQCHGSWARFNQEYPVSPAVAFVSTGFPVFRQKILADMAREAKDNPPVFVGQIEFLSSSEPHPILVEMAYGPLQIWEQPDPGHEYFLGVDCSEGIGSDFNEVIVLSKGGEDIVVAAQYRDNLIQPQEFAVKVWLLGAYYYFGLLGVENNNIGSVVLGVLEHGDGDKFGRLTRYPRLYFETRKDIKNPMETQRMGFRTGSKSKRPAISKLAELLADGDLRIYSTSLINQMIGFTWRPENKDFAQQTKDPISELYNDDGIMACAIANEMRVFAFGQKFLPQAQRSDWI